MRRSARNSAGISFVEDRAGATYTSGGTSSDFRDWSIPVLRPKSSAEQIIRRCSIPHLSAQMSAKTQEKNSLGKLIARDCSAGDQNHSPSGGEVVLDEALACNRHRKFAVRRPSRDAVRRTSQFTRQIFVLAGHQRNQSFQRGGRRMPQLAVVWSRFDKNASPAGAAVRQRRVDGLGRVEGRNLTMQFATKNGPVVALENLDISVKPGEIRRAAWAIGLRKIDIAQSDGRHPQAEHRHADNRRQAGGRPNPGCGIVFQHHSLFPWMSVLENVAFGPTHARQHADPIATARTFLGLVGLEKHGKSLAREPVGRHATACRYCAGARNLSAGAA